MFTISTKQNEPIGSFVICHIPIFNHLIYKQI